MHQDREPSTQTLRSSLSMSKGVTKLIKQNSQTYRVEHQTLQVSFFCDSYGMLQDIYLKFYIETLQTYMYF